jgi:four helix bundle protein
MEENFQFENLKVYQKALDYIDIVFETAKKFPKEELFALTSQFKRASYSIALNIAEGTGGTKKEFAQFLRIAKRSVRECVVCLEIARRAKYISESNVSQLKNQLVEISKMISGLIASIK